MKTNKWLFVLVLVLSFLSLTLVSCQDAPIEVPSVITVDVNTSSKYYIDGEFCIQSDIVTNSFDFSELFVVYKDNQKVWSGYTINSDNFNQETGGEVTCTYQGLSVTAKVVVINKVYELNLSQRSISLKPSEVNSYDFLQYFTAYVDGEPTNISSNMISNGVLPQKGTYAYVVNFHGVAKSLTVVVEDQIELTANKTSVTIKSAQRDSFDYTSLFNLRVNGKNTRVETSSINIDDVPTVEGKGYVYCSYEGKTVSCSIVVNKSSVDIKTKKDSLLLNSARVQTYDYASLFSAIVDGEQIVVTNDMLTGNVQSLPDAYDVSLSLYGVTANLTVNVVNHAVAEAVVNYPSLKLTAEQKQNYDFKTLFTLYVDDTVTPIVDGMLDLTDVEESVGTYKVRLNYDYNVDGVENYSLDANVSIVDSLPISITHTDATVYVNSQAIDLTTLFNIVDDGDEIVVTAEMISGEVNYIVAGVYPVIVAYNGLNDTANVVVKDGAIIRAKSQSVEIKVGTDKYAYDFSNDFEVVVNGVRITNIDQYLDFSTIDFSTAGSVCPVTVSVNYSSKVLGTGVDPEFETISQTINYSVVKNTYELSTVTDLVYLDTDVKSYDPLTNVVLYRNGGKSPLKLTQKASEAGPLDCYVKIEKNVDLSSNGIQQVKLLIYVDGPENDPVELAFNVAVASKIVVTAGDIVAFTDQTLYTTDLFTITVDGIAVPVTSDMVSGYVDLFNAGVYSVKINYNGVKRTANVIVLDKSLVGTYKTLMKTLGTESTVDEEGFAEEGKKSVVLEDVTMNLDLSFEVNGKKGTIIGAIDQNTLTARIGSYIYTLYYQDGVLLFDPDNSNKMTFSDTRRPMIYFKTDLWNVEDGTYYQLSSLSQHVLKGTNTGFTYEIFALTNSSDEEKTIILNVTLVERVSSDSIYAVSWDYCTTSVGEKSETITDDDGNEKQTTVKYVTLNYDGKTETYKMSSEIFGKRVTATNEKIFASKNFAGTFEGKQAILSFDKYEAVSLKQDGVATYVFKVDSYELSNLKNGGVDHQNKTLFVYSYDTSDYYSYKFNLDDTANTFELVKKDSLYGYYICGQDIILYLDGYGTGCVDFSATSEENTLVQVTYTKIGSIVKVTFVDAPSKLGIGSSFELYIADLLNILTIKESVDSKLIGQQLINQKIVDGAIVNFKTLSVGAQQTKTGKEALLGNIEITTANGTLSASDMKKTASNGNSVVDTTCVKFTKAGLYKLSINLDVDGNAVTTDYVVQILDSVYSAKTFVNKVYKTIIGDELTLSFDTYGIATLDNGTAFSGSYVLDESNNIVAKVANGAQKLTLKVEFLSELIIKLSYTGVVNGTAYMSADTIVSVTDGNLKVAKVGTSDVEYIYQNGKAIAIFTPNVLLNSLDEDDVVFKIDEESLVLKVTSWSKGTLIVSDKYIGSYKLDEKTVTIDGFGKIVAVDKSGSYYITSSGYIYVVWDDDIVEVYSTNEGNLTKVDVSLGAVLDGKSFTATYTFFCDYESSTAYKATTTFSFSGDKVTCTSKSSNHDTTSDEMPDHKYNCVLVGMDGTYSVNLYTLTIKFSEYTFVFEMDDLLQVTSLTCKSSGLTYTNDGGFNAGTVFSVVV